ncbi:Protein N-acetyltransferase, RimJ/RimL family [Aquisalimonas asiatica]|uniref:Protein N-acetyltransferase, RimJ/RimL family n=2 Tax=Aquisalimonas asiatica TaxID=406100 RepID=A0A1H8VT45_9GAMM|nr:Protein N-acetyltransferase, RimJ/RimL family [Aquisalimonas asiatica]
MLADPEVMRHSIRGVLTEEDTRGFISWCIGLYQRCGYGPLALEDKESSGLIGFCGLSPETVAGVEEVHVGYRLAQRFWGKGLATEAVRATVMDGFQTHRLGSVIAIVEPGHPASCRVAEKAGFGSIQRQQFHGRDVLVYRRFAPVHAQR